MRTAVLLFGCVVAVVTVAPSSRSDAAADAHFAAREPAPLRHERFSSGSLPCDFEANRGQTAAEVDYLARCAGYVAFLTRGDAVIRTGREAFRLHVVGGNAAKPRESEPRPGRSNYFVGNDAARWVTDVPHVGRVAYEDVLPGVEIAYRTHGRALAFDVTVAPGADPRAVRLKLDGIHWAGPDASGNLSMGLPAGGTARLSAPRAWQDIGGERRSVTAAFAAGAAHDEVAFDVGTYDCTKPLVIDPSLTVSTYLGGSAADQVNSIRTDSSGAIYLTGLTYSTNFPVTTGVLQTSKGEASTSLTDAFVTKLASSGTTVVFSTFLGGNSSDFGDDVAIDSSGSVYVGGFTGSTNFPLQSAFQSTTASGFLTKLNSSGSALTWSTYYGYYPTTIGIDSSGNVHCFNNSSGRAFQFNSAGTSVAYAVTIGGFSPPNFTWTSMAVDPSGTVWLGGYVTNNSGISYASGGAYQANFAGGSYDGWLVKLDGSGNQVYASYLGGSGDDTIRALALDSSGNLLITGTTTSTNFPLASAYQATKAGATSATNVFVTKMNSTATSLVFSTYLGGTGGDTSMGVVANSTGDVFVAGYTNSSDFPTYDAFQSTYGGGTDAFLAEFTSTGSLTRSTYIGGSSTDAAYGVAVSGLGRPLIAGYTSSSNFPTACATQASLSGTSDAFIAGIATSTATFPDLSPVTLTGATLNRQYSQQLTITGGNAPLTWTVQSGTPPAGLSLSTAAVLSGTPTATGTSSIFARVTDSGNACAIREYRITVNPAPVVTTTSLPQSTAQLGYSSQIAAGGGTPPFSWTQTSGALPAGAVLASNGLLSALSLSTPGISTFGVQLVDAWGATASGTVTMNVNPFPSITTPTVAAWTAFRPDRITFQSADGTPPFAWTLKSGTIPIDKPLVASTGVVDGKTQSPGTYPFTIRATDSVGAVVDHDYVMTVNPVPTITSNGMPWAARNRAYAFVATEAGGTLPVTWSVLSGFFPVGLQYSPTTGVFSGTPTSGDFSPFTFRCTDSCGATADHAYGLLVADFLDLTVRGGKETIPFNLQNSTGPTTRYLELLAGTELSFVVQFKGKGDLPVSVRLFDATQTEVDFSTFAKLTTGRVAVKKLPVTKTGRYFLNLTAMGPFEGPIAVQFTAIPQTKWKGTVTVDPAGPPVTVTFSSLSGAKLAASVSATKGSLAVPTISGYTDSTGTELLVPTQLKESKKGAALKAKTALAGGDYVLTIAPRGGVKGDVTWTVTLASPRKYAIQFPDVPVQGTGQ